MHSLTGWRHRLATCTLVGAIAIFLPAAAHAETTRPAPAGGETLAPAADDEAIRPFQFHAADEALADLRRRIAATKWPERETVGDATQGLQLATMQKLARYWTTDYAGGPARSSSN